MIDGLRVMGVQKDKPYARPGEMVELDILLHDTGLRKPGETEGEPRDISIAWLAGCTNPGADLYQGCLPLFQNAFGKARVSDGPVDELSDEQIAALGAEARELGISVGFGPKFRFRVPEYVISEKDPPIDPTQVPYGLNYVFFVACAGELRFNTAGGMFPIACYKNGKELAARDFVAGYTAIYSYDEFRNTNPAILGLEIANTKVPAERLCIGTDCEQLLPDPDRKCDPEDPVVKRCKDPDALDPNCEELTVHLSVDPKSVDIDDSLSARQDADVKEQMWANFHTDRGKFTFDLTLVNDLNTGFHDELDTEYVPPEEPGPAQIWAVVRDNRAGVQWVRTQVCVE